VFVAFLWIFANTVYSQKIIQVKAKNNFLWSIETGKNTLYLLGSFHMLTRSSFPLSKEIENAYNDSQKIVFETDLNALNAPEFQTKMMTLGLYPDGQGLEQNVSEQTYRLLEEKVLAVGLPMAQFSRFKPWLGALTLTVIELQKLGFDPNYGVDSYFFAKAKKDRKEVTFLETVEYQLELFTGLSRGEEESFLRQTLKDLKVVETMFPEMVSAWQNGDVDKLESILRISFEQHPDIYNRLVSQRNRRWIRQIENLLEQDDNVLVIVGAAHLVGSENILGLLKNKGYELEQR
jgi:uncharacterized protein YbaP (TraB family)